MKNTCSNHISSLCSSTCLTQSVITLLVLLASLIFVSCDQLVTDNTTDSNDTIELTPLIDSNTNWLLTCSSNSDCDDREICSCGSCVIPMQTCVAIEAAATTIENSILGIDDNALELKLQCGIALPQDTNTDRVVDKLINGHWSGQIVYDDESGDMEGATFNAVRQQITN